MQKPMDATRSDKSCQSLRSGRWKSSRTEWSALSLLWGKLWAQMQNPRVLPRPRERNQYLCSRVGGWEGRRKVPLPKQSSHWMETGQAGYGKYVAIICFNWIKMPHNSQIDDECQTQSAKVLALSWKWACQYNSSNTDQPICEFQPSFLYCGLRCIQVYPNP